jgi:CMP-2-keto-3-deoxyoctulosonic acid synthetase
MRRGCSRSTACTPLAHDQVAMRQRVKCVTDAAGYAIYFSRSVIPGNKDGAVRMFPQPFAERPYLLHLGLQCYDRRFLREYCRMAPTPLMVCMLQTRCFCMSTALSWSDLVIVGKRALRP